MNEQAFEPWIGVDLDGCLAEAIESDDLLRIGKPVDAMVQRVRKWLADGQEVKILTPRVTRFIGGVTCHAYNAANEPVVSPEGIREAVRAWCEKHIGCTLDVVCEIDPGMTEWWSSRCVQVERNTGKRLYVHREYTMS